MARNLFLQTKAAEPPIRQVEFYILTKPAFRAGLIAIADQKHPDHQFRIDRWASRVTIERGEFTSKPAQIENRIDPPQFFRSPRFKRILSDLEARFDYIVFDCPPCSAGTDTETLAGKLDGILLVVKYQGTRREIIKNSKDKLEKSKGRVLGVVLNSRRYEIPEFIYRRL